jgi:hypothetical protein
LSSIALFFFSFENETSLPLWLAPSSPISCADVHCLIKCKMEPFNILPTFCHLSWTWLCWLELVGSLNTEITMSQSMLIKIMAQTLEVNMELPCQLRMTLWQTCSWETLNSFQLTSLLGSLFLVCK